VIVHRHQPVLHLVSVHQSVEHLGLIRRQPFPDLLAELVGLITPRFWWLLEH
jgi:hypothetical protein